LPAIPCEAEGRKGEGGRVCSMFLRAMKKNSKEGFRKERRRGKASSCPRYAKGGKKRGNVLHPCGGDRRAREKRERTPTPSKGGERYQNYSEWGGGRVSEQFRRERERAFMPIFS